VAGKANEKPEPTIPLKYRRLIMVGAEGFVHGINRRSSSFNSARIDYIYQEARVPGAPFQIHYGDMTDSTNLIRIIPAVQPDE
jgi:GDPmannose 4,6-dehydratase